MPLNRELVAIAAVRLPAPSSPSSLDRARRTDSRSAGRQIGKAGRTSCGQNIGAPRLVSSGSSVQQEQHGQQLRDRLVCIESTLFSVPPTLQSSAAVGFPALAQAGWLQPSVVDDVQCTPWPCRAIWRDTQNMGTIQSFTGVRGSLLRLAGTRERRARRERTLPHVPAAPS